MIPICITHDDLHVDKSHTIRIKIHQMPKFLDSIYLLLNPPGTLVMYTVFLDQVNSIYHKDYRIVLLSSMIRLIQLEFVNQLFYSVKSPFIQVINVDTSLFLRLSTSC